MFFLGACSVLNPTQPSENELQLRETLDALEAKNLKLELEATERALQSTQTAVGVPNQPIDNQPTVVTSNQSIETQPVFTPPVTQSTDAIQIPSVLTFEEWMKTAKILLYEDIVGIPKVERYVKGTLEIMKSRYGIDYDDVGNAKGWLKERLIFGAEGGVPWDLIIIAVEARGGVSGEFFEYLQDNLDQGSSVILEIWYLDQISEGKVEPILEKCGVNITNYVGSLSRQPIDLVLWPLTTHPILTEPNNYPKLTKVIYFWPPNDLGDYMELSGTGDAQLLYGRKAGETTRLGTLTVCLKGQLIIQTFSNHNYFGDAMNIAWENYIWNALKVRYYGAQE
jgi:hypothetical protein